MAAPAAYNPRPFPYSLGGPPGRRPDTTTMTRVIGTALQLALWSVLLGFFVLVAIPRITPLDVLVVRGGSMEPTIAVGSVLICVGPASQRFVETLGVSVPVDRVPGLLAVTSAVTERVERVVHAPGVHLRPDAGGGLLLGAGDLDAPAARATASADVAPGNSPGAA